VRKPGIGWSVAIVLCSHTPAAPAAGPLFEEAAVFVGGMDGINTYRIPSVVCTKKGTLLVFCEGRRDSESDGSPTHLVLKRSLGNFGAWQPGSPGQSQSGGGARAKPLNLTWEPMQTLITSHGTEAFMNPVPVIDESDGEIVLLVNRYLHFGKAEDEGRGQVQTLLLRSRDEGASWSDSLDITSSVGRVALGPGIGIQTRRGSLVVPTYVGVLRSDDRGRTWKAGGEISSLPNETQVVELADGSLMLSLRGNPNRTVFISKDEGTTWGFSWKDPALTDPEQWGGCQASLIRYTRKDDGETRNRLLFANPADLRSRLRLTVRMSYDEGRTWPVSKLVTPGPAAYSSMTIFPDGSVGLVYEAGSRREGKIKYSAQINFGRFNLEWLTDGKDRLAQAGKWAGRVSDLPNGSGIALHNGLGTALEGMLIDALALDPTGSAHTFGVPKSNQVVNCSKTPCKPLG